MDKGKRWLPLTGLGFFVLAIVAFAVGGEPPNPTDDSARKIVDFYVDNEGAQITSALLAALAATLFVFFGGCLRRVLRDAEGPEGVLSAVAFAGTIIFATGVAIDSTITFTLVDAADDISPASVETLSALYSNDFMPFAVGMQLLMLSTGISVVRHGALPKWIGWVAILIGVIAVTPIGFASFIAGCILVAVISVLLTMRGGRPEAPRPDAAGSAGGAA